MNTKLKAFLLVIATFIFIYHPPILPVNILHVLALISWVIILVKKKTFYRVMRKGRYINEIAFSVLMLIYLYLVLLLNQSDNYMIGYDFIIILLEILPICYIIIYYSKKMEYYIKFYDLLLLAGFIQGIISIIAFLIPNFQNTIMNIMINYGYNPIIIKMSGHRMYGFSAIMPFSMPIVQGILTTLSLYLSTKKSIKYLIFTPVLAISGIINARICIPVIAIGILMVLVINIRMNIKTLSRIIIIFIISMLLIPKINILIQENSPKTYNWINEGIDEITNLLNGKLDGSYIGYVTDKEQYKVPQGLNLFFGTANKVIRGNSVYSSDVGYINDIWLGGILYTLFLGIYVLYKLNCIKKYLNNSIISGVTVSIYLLLIITICNFKGNIFKVSEILNLFYLISIYSLCSYNSQYNLAIDTN